ncbi:hypothetical protein E2C01_055369 [Portunus trituberculatus]|uniref:Uncharacterized protein n=1 Tax=Portunus trituberculatus TaxID=210409 RepID=A0A5B7GM93_PORTR|nr:hypothetical protein [Portunus trituberculatus]
MELENIVANTVYLKAREGKEMYGKVAMSAIVLRPLSSALTHSLLARKLSRIGGRITQGRQDLVKLALPRLGRCCLERHTLAMDVQRKGSDK